ncbi:MAG: hypothetical protein H7839_17735, partial [Magnetococcus sp. YQC-5]
MFSTTKKKAIDQIERLKMQFSQMDGLPFGDILRNGVVHGENFLSCFIYYNRQFCQYLLSLRLWQLALRFWRNLQTHQESADGKWLDLRMDVSAYGAKPLVGSRGEALG